MYGALSLLARTRSAGYSVTTWLDALTGALSIGAIVSALAFDPVVALTGGDPATITVNLAYPTGDVLLWGSALASLLVHGWRGDRAIGLLGAAMGIAAVADAFYMVDTAMGVYDNGAALGAGWPLAALLVAGRLARAGRSPAGDARREPALAGSDGGLRGPRRARARARQLPPRQCAGRGARPRRRCRSSSSASRSPVARRGRSSATACWRARTT